MKKLTLRLLASLVILLALTGCNSDEGSSNNKQLYFLSDIRPDFFENLNFESETVLNNMNKFRTNFAETYAELEDDYTNGAFKSESDLEYMRLSGMYYAFYLLALGGNYIDGNISFENIMGNPVTGFYSGLPSSTPDFEQKEMEAMMDEAARVGEIAYQLNGYNDKAYGFYISVKQVGGRLKNNGKANDSEIHNRVIDYVGVRLENFDLLPDWNVLMSMVTFTNYSDSLNTFRNPRMNEVLDQVNERLVPGALPPLGGLFPEIFGPLYRFDLNMKKMDWYIQKTDEFTSHHIKQLDTYIEQLEGATVFIENERTEILERWDDNYTFTMRKEKLDEVKKYSEKLKEGLSNIEKPELYSFLNSDDFKKAYQCYTCHKPTGLNN